VASALFTNSRVAFRLFGDCSLVGSLFFLLVNQVEPGCSSSSKDFRRAASLVRDYLSLLACSDTKRLAFERNSSVPSILMARKSSLSLIGVVGEQSLS
jgi:hypothetical protein